MTPNHPRPMDPSGRRHRTLFTLRGPATLLIVIPWLVGAWTILSYIVNALR